jgi:phospholipid/cholesterol/gamma-HCH transport system substrate-binding protein
MRRIIATAALLATIALVFFAQGSGGSGGSYELRGIFDNGAFLVTGEDVRVAGAKVGSVSTVDVTMPGEWANRDESPDPGKAVVVMDITSSGFQDFRQDASCIIRPASLLGEKYVDCQPTQAHAPGTEPPPPLKVIPSGQPGAGQHFLPLQNNGKEVDIDLVNNIMREPFADRFRLILNDLGASLAARGKDLAAIVKRADPALKQTDRILRQLANQNQELATLAKNSDKVLTPLARERAKVAGFIHNANTAGEATAERSAALEAGFEKFPAALQALRRQMVQLQHFANQAAPTFADFANAAPNLTRSTEALGPFAKASTPALLTLGKAASEAQQPLVNSDPTLKKIRDLARKAPPAARGLSTLLSSLRKSGGDKQLMKLLYFTNGGINGFDKFGHFLRANLQVTASCVNLVQNVGFGCDAGWGASEGKAKQAAIASKLQNEAVTPSQLANLTATSNGGVNAGVPLDAHGDAAGASRSKANSHKPKPHAPSLSATKDLLNTIIGKPGQVQNSGGTQSGQYTTPSQGQAP